VNHEGGPLSLLALGPNGPLVGLNDGLDDGVSKGEKRKPSPLVEHGYLNLVFDIT